MFSGGKNHVNDLRSDALKRIRASDNQLITKEHFIRMEADKCQSSTAYDQSTSGPVAEYDYIQNKSATATAVLKEHKSYFMEKSYYNSDQRTRPCDSYGVDGSNGSNGSNATAAATTANDENNHSHENDFDESISMNGDNYLVTSSGTANNTDNNRHNSTHRNAKRKHAKDDAGVNNDNNSVFHKMYKNNCGDIMQNKFDYLSNFDGIRPRNIDEMQNDDHHRMVDGSDGDYRNNGNEMNTNRCGGGSSDDGATNINVNYASSDDLNQTNTSEHDDKILSGSDDESGGKLNIPSSSSSFFFNSFQI